MPGTVLNRVWTNPIFTTAHEGGTILEMRKQGLENLRSLSKATQLVTVGAEFNTRPSCFRDEVMFSFATLSLSHLLIRGKQKTRKEGRKKRKNGRKE